MLDITGYLTVEEQDISRFGFPKLFGS